MKIDSVVKKKKFMNQPKHQVNITFNLDIEQQLSIILHYYNVRGFSTISLFSFVEEESSCANLNFSI